MMCSLNIVCSHCWRICTYDVFKTFTEIDFWSMLLLLFRKLRWKYECSNPCGWKKKTSNTTFLVIIFLQEPGSTLTFCIILCLCWNRMVNQTVYHSIKLHIKYFQPVLIILELLGAFVPLDSSIETQGSELLKR